MKVYDAPNIRNVALVGHGGCGKTSLASALLFDAGAVNRLGRVEDGTTVTDFDPDEIERKISLLAAPAFAEWKKAKINLSTPRATRTSSRRPAPPCGWRTPRWSWWTPWRGSRSRRRRSGASPRSTASRASRGEPDGPGERLVRAHGGEDPGGLRARRGAGRGAGRRGEGLQGRRRPRVREGAGVRRRRQRQVPGDRRARRPGGTGEGLAREARGDGGGEQRGAHGGVLREGDAVRGAAGEGAAERGGSRQGLPGAARLVPPERRCPRRPRRDRGPRCPRPRTAAR